ncbi:MAG: hypothetical protein GY729_03915, partial [Desulfobacteraceae bacterium]|nr:hypothetical protein [Desulfobacteraceae bacterium]
MALLFQKKGLSFLILMLFSFMQPLYANDFSDHDQAILDQIKPYYKILKPASSPPFPSVIMLHGAQQIAWRIDIQKLAARLADSGFSTVFINSYADRGINGQSLLKGELLPAQRSKDLAVTLNWLLTQNWIDKDKIAVWGQSHGAATIMDSFVLASRYEADPVGDLAIYKNIKQLKAAVMFSPWCQEAYFDTELVLAIKNNWDLKIPVLAFMPGKDIYGKVCAQVLSRHIRMGYPIKMMHFPDAFHTFYTP